MHIFPDPQFFGFWARHLAPVWAAAVMALNAVFGSNYGYLNAEPFTPSLLDLLGPWPWYVLVEAVLIVVVWALITWPWNRGPHRRGSAGPDGRDRRSRC